MKNNNSSGGAKPANLAKDMLNKKRLADLNSKEEALTYELNDQIPDTVFDHLPKILKESCAIFKDKYERDVYLTGALSVLGGCFHNVTYYNEIDKTGVAPNLISFIIAPPASGKGALKFARYLIQGVKEIFADSTGKLKAKKQKKLIIPANNSSAGLIQILKQNEGVGVMIEPEIDTLVNANKQDWGNYSEIIRVSFHNESVSLYRKGDREYIDIPNVKFSLAISGTPNQFRSLVTSSENGLFSRGCYYVFQNTSSKLQCYGRYNTTKDIVDHFKDYSNSIKECYQRLLKESKISVIFTKDQLDKIQEILQSDFDQVREHQELHGTIRRAFTLVSKIATTLSCLSAFEAGTISAKIQCSETNLNVAIDLMLIYLRHSYKAYELLPCKESHPLNVSQQRVWISLPEKFTKKEAIDLHKSLGISQRNVYNAFEFFKSKGMIKLLSDGNYEKVLK